MLVATGADGHAAENLQRVRNACIECLVVLSKVNKIGREGGARSFPELISDPAKANHNKPRIQGLSTGSYSASYRIMDNKLGCEPTNTTRSLVARMQGVA
jgi:hypothetical protein